ncbi:MAG: polysaccharide export protein [Verrucomicrobiales bacterium]|nr:polysaccharide export protein [Verrucomicrobiales bacterium]
MKIGDIVSVNVFDEPSLTGAFQVGPAGNIVFPLLGGIQSVGLSPDELAKAVESRLEADYIRDAQVSVAIAEEAELPPHTVTVIGQVYAPGQVPFKVGESIDLFTAIASAGGLTERGNKSRIELKRRSGSDLTTQILNLESNRVLALKDGDTLIVHAIPEVMVEEEKVVFVTVIGEVRKPGQLPMNPENPYDLIGAIAMAGGFTDLAKPSKVVVRRRTAEGVKTYELNVSKMQKDQSKPFILAPDDTISVPESFF